MAFGRHIRLLREKKNISAQKIADYLGVDASRLRKWEEKDLNPRDEDTKKIELAFGIPMASIMKLKELPEFQTVPIENEPNTPYLSQRRNQKNNAATGKRIPLYDAPAAAGTTETDMTAIHAPAGTIDVGDLLNDSQSAIRIYGNSMIPNYPPGCVVGLAKCSSKFIEPGEVYVIETRDRRMLKRIFYKDDDAESDYFLCYSDNLMKFEGGARDGKLAYPPFILPKSEIINLFSVTGVIKRNTNSVIINRNL